MQFGRRVPLLLADLQVTARRAELLVLVLVLVLVLLVLLLLLNPLALLVEKRGPICLERCCAASEVQ